MHTASPTLRRITPGVLLGALIVVLGACALMTSTVDTTRALQSEGFGAVRVIPTALNRGTAVRVTAQPPPGAAQPEQLAARAVWEHFEFRFSRVEVNLSGRTPTAFGRAQLLATLGPRPAGYDRRSVTGSLGRVVAIVVGVGGVTVLVIVALIAVLVVRRRRRKAAPPQGGPGYGPPPSPPWPSEPAPPQPPSSGYGPPREETRTPSEPFSSKAPPPPDQILDLPREGYGYRSD